MGFFKLKSDNLAAQKKAGDGIVKVSKSVFKANSEWAKFDKDTRKWLFDHGYIYVDAKGKTIGNGKAPADLELVPVYDTPNRMHVRIPWHGDLADVKTIEVKDELPYGGSFPALLARYFMRKCR